MKTINVKHENKSKEKKEPLDKCISAPHPEMARNSESDEPCETE